MRLDGGRGAGAGRGAGGGRRAGGRAGPDEHWNPVSSYYEVCHVPYTHIIHNENLAAEEPWLVMERERRRVLYQPSDPSVGWGGGGGGGAVGEQEPRIGRRHIPRHARHQPAGRTAELLQQGHATVWLLLSIY